MTRDSVVLDYGCGPGFLAKAAAPLVGRVYGCDISTGALACARVLNGDDRIEYVLATPRGMRVIPEGSVDVVFRTLAGILGLCFSKLKPGGKILPHAQTLDDGTWKSWAEWRADKSLRGRIRYRYGLHCFGRDRDDLQEIVRRHGFTRVMISPISDLVEDNFDDVCGQHLLTAEKP